MLTFPYSLQGAFKRLRMYKPNLDIAVSLKEELFDRNAYHHSEITIVFPYESNLHLAI